VALLKNSFSKISIIIVLAFVKIIIAQENVDQVNKVLSLLPVDLQSKNPINSSASHSLHNFPNFSSTSDTHLVKTITQLWDSLEWKNKSKTHYYYNSENQCESMVEYTAGNHWVERARDLYSYDSYGNLFETIKQKKDVTTSWDNYRKYQFLYTKDAKIDSILMQRWDEDKWQVYYEFSYSYDNAGLLVESNQYRYGRYQFQTTFSYDSLGNIISFLKIYPIGFIRKNYKKGHYTYEWDKKLIEYNEYQAYGNYNEEWRPYLNKSSRYNDIDMLLREDIDYDYLRDSTITFIYNGNKNLFKVNCETSQNDQILEQAQTTYYYDDYSKDELKYVNQQADYLIITPSQFIEPISDFATWRQKNGLNVKVVLLEQLYYEFEDTPGNHQSIREFISYTQKYWADPKPKFVLLVGDTDIIPAYSINSNIEGEGKIPIDEWFVINQYDSDEFPDLAIGRWPVTNETELKNIITKTIAFESGQGVTQSLQNILFLNDEDTNPATITVFEDLSSSFISTIIPPKFHTSRIDIREDSPFHYTKQDFLSQINSGIGHLIYYGHGTPTSWSREAYLTCDDVSLLEQNNLPFILSTMGCGQDFSLPDEKSLVEELLLFPSGGAVATIASSGISGYITGNKFLSKVYSQLFQDKEKSLGEIVLKVKNGTYTENTKADDMTRRYTLLGDPALRIPFDLITKTKDSQKDIPNDYALLANYPNPFNSSTTIQYKLKKASHIEITIFDIHGKIINRLINKEQQAGFYTLNWNGKNGNQKAVSSGQYFVKLNANGFHEINKMVLIK
jgi:hypothetical protein